MRTKITLRFGLTAFLLLVILRSLYIALPLNYPDVICYDENHEVIEIDQEIVDRLVASAKACQTEVAINPLGLEDYARAFFFGGSFDPQVSIVDLRRVGAGYRVVFHGYRERYRAIYHISQNFEVVLAGENRSSK